MPIVRVRTQVSPFEQTYNVSKMLNCNRNKDLEFGAGDEPEPILPGSIARDESSSSLASSRENGTTKSTPWDRATFSTPLQTPHRAEKDVEPETIIDNVAIEESGEGQHEKVIDIDVTRVTISQPKEMSESKGREKNSKDQEPVIDT
eukprot:CAMPEP_0114500356 /NCGR_PEP_ID=MMETSP0109-20121206/7919_1 /TAXON_ID=29199 /ORGANISM="Chlorarachnion reptans, Strain CCCM449" /LENGTH=146 /DNA_ID=CAMNT_0001678009 /DNA_START=443 /DNA_END=881 /DNA_ORIENTATION=-